MTLQQLKRAKEEELLKRATTAPAPLPPLSQQQTPSQCSSLILKRDERMSDRRCEPTQQMKQRHRSRSPRVSKSRRRSRSSSRKNDSRDRSRERSRGLTEHDRHKLPHAAAAAPLTVPAPMQPFPLPYQAAMNMHLPHAAAAAPLTLLAPQVQQFPLPYQAAITVQLPPATEHCCPPLPLCNAAFVSLRKFGLTEERIEWVRCRPDELESFAKRDLTSRPELRSLLLDTVRRYRAQTKYHAA